MLYQIIAAAGRRRASAGGGGFTPADLAPEGWWVSDVGITLSGSAVTLWANQGTSGTLGDMAPGLGGPIYDAADVDFNGLPSLDFAGFTELDSPANNFWALAAEDDSLTVVVVMYDDTASTAARFPVATNNYSSGGFRVQTQGGGTDTLTVSTVQSGGARSIVATNTAYAPAKLTVLALKHRGAVTTAEDALTAFVDGLGGATARQDLNAAVSNGTLRQLQFGSNNAGTPQFDGRLAEVLLIKRLLTPAEDADLATYLNARYGTALVAVAGWTPALLAAEGVWYSDTGVTESAGEVTLWANQGTAGSAADFTPSGANKGGTYAATDADVAGAPSIAFDGATTAMETAAGPWWHLAADGDDFTLVIVQVNDAVDTVGRRVLATNNYAARGGFRVLQFASTTDTNRIQVEDVGGVAAVSAQITPGVKAGTAIVSAYEYAGEVSPTQDAAEVYVDGSGGGAINVDQGVIAASVDSEMYLGATETGSPSYVGRVVHMLWLKRRLTTAEEGYYAAWISETYGVSNATVTGN